MDSKKILDHLKDIKFKLDNIDMIVYHHNCPDGFGASWVAWRYLKSDATFIGARPDMAFEPKKFKGKTVLFLDISISRTKLDAILKVAENAIIIDHHQTYYEELKDHPHVIMHKEHSAIYMAWRIFFPDQKVPNFVKLIEDKDLGETNYKNTEYFSAALGVKLPFHSLEHFRLWNRLLNQKYVDDLIETGRKYYEYKKYLIHRNYHIIVPMQFGKHTVGVGNFEAVGLTSDLANALSERNPQYDFICLWSYHYNEDLYSVMLRTRNDGVDLAAIAKIYGGGGHPRAARFTWMKTMSELFKDWKKTVPVALSVANPKKLTKSRRKPKSSSKSKKNSNK